MNSISQGTPTRAGFLGLSGYHWLVIGAAWAGWGFDVFDALLFNFVAPNCVPALLGLPHGTPEAHEATVFWTGALSSLLLIGWAAGGVLFGWIADRIGRKQALFATVALYAAGTALCAAATNIGQLIAFRVLASLGIGGEWGIGAVLVAETVPEDKRVTAGVILQSSSPLGIVLASTVNYFIAGVWFAGQPENSWRYVFLAGLAPVVLALAIRAFVHESPQWSASKGTSTGADAGTGVGASAGTDPGADARAGTGSDAGAGSGARARPPTPSELFSPQMMRRTLSGAIVAAIIVITWWACNAFVPLLGSTLAAEHVAQVGMPAADAKLLLEAWKARASNFFNFGGLVGSFAAIVLTRLMGRRPMLVTYFLYSALLIFLTFGLDLTAPARLAMLFLVGTGVYGAFGALTFYLPELYPARLRATGSGFSYNIGRLAAAFGPVAVGMVSARAGGSSTALGNVLLWVGVIPLIAALTARLYIVETRGQALQ